MKLLKMAVAASLMMLASCGGDSGSGGATVQVPQPSPTPTPAPSPTPSPVYPLSDLTQDWRAASPGAELRLFGSADFFSPSRVITSSDTYVSSGSIDAQMDYKSVDKSASFTFRGSTTNFSTADVNSVENWYRIYTRRDTVSGPLQTFGFSVSDGFRYIIVNSQQIIELTPPFPETRRLALGGARTVVSDMPTSGKVAYKSIFNPGLPDLIFYEAMVSIDYGTGLVEGRFMTSQGLPPRPDEIKATLILTGRLVSGQNQFTGSITSPDSAYTGQFIGELFGPRGTEMGALFKLDHPTNRRAIGFIQGIRQ